MENGWQLTPVATVRSPLRDRAVAPRQADEGAPPAWREFDAAYAQALAGVAPGDELLVLSWLHAADRTTQTVTPRGDLSPRRPACSAPARRTGPTRSDCTG